MDDSPSKLSKQRRRRKILMQDDDDDDSTPSKIQSLIQSEPSFITPSEVEKTTSSFHTERTISSFSSIKRSETTSTSKRTFSSSSEFEKSSFTSSRYTDKERSSYESSSKSEASKVESHSDFTESEGKYRSHSRTDESSSVHKSSSSSRDLPGSLAGLSSIENLRGAEGFHRLRPNLGEIGKSDHTSRSMGSYNDFGRITRDDRDLSIVDTGKSRTYHDQSTKEGHSDKSDKNSSEHRRFITDSEKYSYSDKENTQVDYTRSDHHEVTERRGFVAPDEVMSILGTNPHRGDNTIGRQSHGLDSLLSSGNKDTHTSTDDIVTGRKELSHETKEQTKHQIIHDVRSDEPDELPEIYVASIKDRVRLMRGSVRNQSEEPDDVKSDQEHEAVIDIHFRSDTGTDDTTDEGSTVHEDQSVKFQLTSQVENEKAYTDQRSESREDDGRNLSSKSDQTNTEPKRVATQQETEYEIQQAYVNVPYDFPNSVKSKDQDEVASLKQDHMKYNTETTSFELQTTLATIKQGDATAEMNMGDSLVYPDGNDETRERLLEGILDRKVKPIQTYNADEMTLQDRAIAVYAETPTGSDFSEQESGQFSRIKLIETNTLQKLEHQKKDHVEEYPTDVIYSVQHDAENEIVQKDEDQTGNVPEYKVPAMAATTTGKEINIETETQATSSDTRDYLAQHADLTHGIKFMEGDVSVTGTATTKSANEIQAIEVETVNETQTMPSDTGVDLAEQGANLTDGIQSTKHQIIHDVRSDEPEELPKIHVASIKDRVRLMRASVRNQSEEPDDVKSDQEHEAVIDIHLRPDTGTDDTTDEGSTVHEDQSVNFQVASQVENEKAYTDQRSESREDDGRNLPSKPDQTNTEPKRVATQQETEYEIQQAYVNVPYDFPNSFKSKDQDEVASMKQDHIKYNTETTSFELQTTLATIKQGDATAETNTGDSLVDLDGNDETRERLLEGILDRKVKPIQSYNADEMIQQNRAIAVYAETPTGPDFSEQESGQFSRIKLMETNTLEKLEHQEKDHVEEYPTDVIYSVQHDAEIEIVQKDEDKKGNIPEYKVPAMSATITGIEINIETETQATSSDTRDYLAQHADLTHGIKLMEGDLSVTGTATTQSANEIQATGFETVNETQTMPSDTGVDLAEQRANLTDGIQSMETGISATDVKAPKSEDEIQLMEGETEHETPALHTETGDNLSELADSTEPNKEVEPSNLKMDVTVKPALSRQSNIGNVSEEIITIQTGIVTSREPSADLPRSKQLAIPPKMVGSDEVIIIHGVPTRSTHEARSYKILQQDTKGEVATVNLSEEKSYHTGSYEVERHEVRTYESQTYNIRLHDVSKSSKNEQEQQIKQEVNEPHDTSPPEVKRYEIRSIETTKPATFRAQKFDLRSYAPRPYQKPQSLKLRSSYLQPQTQPANAQPERNSEPPSHDEPDLYHSPPHEKDTDDLMPYERSPTEFQPSNNLQPYALPLDGQPERKQKNVEHPYETPPHDEETDELMTYEPHLPLVQKTDNLQPLEHAPDGQPEKKSEDVRHTYDTPPRGNEPDELILYDLHLSTVQPKDDQDERSSYLQPGRKLKVIRQPYDTPPYIEDPGEQMLYESNTTEQRPNKNLKPDEQPSDEHPFETPPHEDPDELRLYHPLSTEVLPKDEQPEMTLADNLNQTEHYDEERHEVKSYQTMAYESSPHDTEPQELPTFATPQTELQPQDKKGEILEGETLHHTKQYNVEKHDDSLDSDDLDEIRRYDSHPHDTQYEKMPLDKTDGYEEEIITIQTHKTTAYKEVPMDTEETDTGPYQNQDINEPRQILSQPIKDVQLNKTDPLEFELLESSPLDPRTIELQEFEIEQSDAQSKDHRDKTCHDEFQTLPTRNAPYTEDIPMEESPDEKQTDELGQQNTETLKSPRIRPLEVALHPTADDLEPKSQPTDTELENQISVITRREVVASEETTMHELYSVNTSTEYETRHLAKDSESDTSLPDVKMEHVTVEDTQLEPIYAEPNDDVSFEQILVLDDLPKKNDLIDETSFGKIAFDTEDVDIMHSTKYKSMQTDENEQHKEQEKQQFFRIDKDSAIDVERTEPYEVEKRRLREYEMPYESRPYDVQQPELPSFKTQQTEEPPSDTKDDVPSISHHTEQQDAKRHEVGPYKTISTDDNFYYNQPYHVERREIRSTKTTSYRSQRYEVQPPELQSFETEPCQIEPEDKMDAATSDDNFYHTESYDVEKREIRPFETTPYESRLYDPQPDELHDHEVGPEVEQFPPDKYVPTLDSDEYLPQSNNQIDSILDSPSLKRKFPETLEEPEDHDADPSSAPHVAIKRKIRITTSNPFPTAGIRDARRGGSKYINVPSKGVDKLRTNQVDEKRFR